MVRIGKGGGCFKEGKRGIIHSEVKALQLYQETKEGIFLSRPNRFIAYVEVDGTAEICHVKNTGRCRELLVPGAKVTLSVSQNPLRKTKYDLVAVQKGDLFINMDSQAPNHAAGEALWRILPGVKNVKPEVTHGESRLDFCVDTEHGKHFVEVKGVTLEKAGLALFPDAPTGRGIKHLHTLIRCIEEGHKATALFVIQMKGVHGFSPHDEMHPAFGKALREARAAGVQVLAYDCVVTEKGMKLDAPVQVLL